ncbi:hypothetical protein IWQ61_008068 [Dispira simplex]|nr:hypothetical protein IWQ61_008068 [Dispira simplex]
MGFFFGTLTSFLPLGGARGTRLTPQECSAIAQVKSRCSDADINFIAYLVHATHQQGAAETTALVDEVSAKIQRWGTLYPREPTATVLTGDSSDMPTVYANYYLDALNSLFPHWAVDELRIWLGKTVLRRVPLVTHPPVRTTATQSSASPQSNSLSLSLSSLSLTFPELLADQYFEHQYQCLTSTPQRRVPKTRTGRQKWHKCPHQLLPSDSPSVRAHHGVIRSPEYFRSLSYRDGAYRRLANAFSMLYRSTIEAVLAENNFDYTTSYHQLDQLRHQVPNTWLATFLKLLPNRPTINECPSMYHLSLLEDMDQVEHTCAMEQIMADRQVAQQVNQDEYTQCEQLIPCGCCYGDFAFEDLVGCTHGHLCCGDCVERFVQELTFGQGTSTSTDYVQCIGDSDCTGHYLLSALQTCLSQTLYHDYQKYITEQSLQRWQRGITEEEVLRCPFCHYTVVQPKTPMRNLGIWCKHGMWILIHVALAVYFGVIVIPFVQLIMPEDWDWLFLWTLGTVLVTVLLLCVSHMVETGRAFRRCRQVYQRAFYNATRTTVVCQNPACRKSVCPSCQALFTPDHQCGESSQDALRRYVEQAMNEAVKRTVSYTMCYVCRRDIAKESYSHFCQHFRIIPGSACQECSKCDLYRCEDEQTARKRAAERAQQEYLRTMGSTVDDPGDMFEGLDDFYFHNIALQRLEQCLENAVVYLVEYLLILPSAGIHQ